MSCGPSLLRLCLPNVIVIFCHHYAAGSFFILLIKQTFIKFLHFCNFQPQEIWGRWVVGEKEKFEEMDFIEINFISSFLRSYI